MGNIKKSAEDKFIGTTLAESYHILDLIGVGGMGRVYRAEQSPLGRTVAVKLIHPHLLADDSSAARFLTEARAASQLNHPNSISVFDFGRTDDGTPYLVMELLRGQSLDALLVEEGLPLDPARALFWVRQAARGLAAAHRQGLVHRDIKPSNLWVVGASGSDDELVKVLDFGLVKSASLGEGVTGTGEVVGTPVYMSPEQILGSSGPEIAGSLPNQRIGRLPTCCRNILAGCRNVLATGCQKSHSEKRTIKLTIFCLNENLDLNEPIQEPLPICFGRLPSYFCSLSKNVGSLLAVCQQLLAGCQKSRKPPIRARTEAILLAYFQERKVRFLPLGFCGRRSQDRAGRGRWWRTKPWSGIPGT